MIVIWENFVKVWTNFGNVIENFKVFKKVLKVFKKILKVFKKILIIVNTIKYLMRIMYKEQPKIWGADSIENNFSKIWGAGAPQACRWKTPWMTVSVTVWALNVQAYL